MKTLLIESEPTIASSGMRSTAVGKQRFVQSYVPLRAQIADLCVLERYIIEMLDVQQFESELQEHPAALRMVTKCLDILYEHTAQLSTMLDTLPPQKNQLQRSAAVMAGMFVGFVSKMRPRDLPAMLRDDFTVLNMAAMSCAMLHTAGLVLGDVNVAKLALIQLRELVSLVQAIGHLMPSTVEQQLAQQCVTVDSGERADVGADLTAIWPDFGSPV